MKKNGFTLIELLVVISIMVIVAITVIVSFGGFEEDANLKNEAFNLQSYLRLAQANAQTGVKCPDGKGGSDWSIIINDRVTINLNCGTQNVRGWQLNPPALILAIDGATCSSSFTSGGTISQSITINFSYLSGKANFEDQDTTNNCLKESSSMVITLKKKLDSPDVKTVTITKGGAIDVE